MSYILDALQRADAERQRGTVPSLHARQVTTPTQPATSDGPNRLWLAAGAVLMLGALLAAGWWFWRAPSGTARPAEVPIALSTPSPAAMAPQPPVQLASPPAQVPTQAPVPLTPPQKNREPYPKPDTSQRRVIVPKPAAPPTAIATPASPIASRSKPEAVVAKAVSPSASAPAVPTPAPVAKTPASRDVSADLPLLSELPEDLRRQIPAMVINGVVYSENPGQRVLLVNQQVLTQGSQAVPEVRLEEIQRRSSVFSFRGTRFRLAH